MKTEVTKFACDGKTLTACGVVRFANKYNFVDVNGNKITQKDLVNPEYGLTPSLTLIKPNCQVEVTVVNKDVTIDIGNVVIKKIGNEHVVNSTSLTPTAKKAMQSGKQLKSNSGTTIFYAKQSKNGRWYYKAKLSNKKLFGWSK